MGLFALGDALRWKTRDRITVAYSLVQFCGTRSALAHCAVRNDKHEARLDIVTYDVSGTARMQSLASCRALCALARGCGHWVCGVLVTYYSVLTLVYAVSCMLYRMRIRGVSSKNKETYKYESIVSCCNALRLTFN
jgi:hypothetical protein